MWSETCAERLNEAAQPVLQQAERLRDDELHKRPHEGDWSAAQILAHVAELAPYWARQAATIARRDLNDLPFGRTLDDPDRVAAVEVRRDDTLDHTVARLRAGLAEAVALLRSLPEDAWSRTGHHPRRGEMTVQQVVDDFLIDHLGEHAAQLEATVLALRETAN